MEPGIKEPGGGREPRRTGGAARRLVWLAALSVQTACLAIPLGREGAPVLERKVVVQKKAPNLLQAADQTWCETAPKKYDSVKVGDAVWCVWKC